MRFLHPEYAWWLLAALAAVALLKWRVRWRFAAFTVILPDRGRLFRASLFRRLPEKHQRAAPLVLHGRQHSRNAHPA